MIGIFLSYVLAFLITLFAIVGGFLALRRLYGQKLCWGSFLIGILVAIGCLVGVLFLFRLSFADAEYYNTVLFRSLIGGVYLFLISGIRFLLTKSIFFNRYREPQGYSFALGYGLAPTLFLSLYLLVMTLALAYNALFNGPAVITNEYLSFGNTIFSIFQPVAGHISFAAVFALYLVIVLASFRLADKSTTKNYRAIFVVLWSVLVMLSEAVALLPIPFIKMYELSHWQLLLIVGPMAIVATVLCRFIPKRPEVETTYTKQFE